MYILSKTGAEIANEKEMENVPRVNPSPARRSGRGMHS